MIKRTGHVVFEIELDGSSMPSAILSLFRIHNPPSLSSKDNVQFFFSFFNLKMLEEFGPKTFLRVNNNSFEATNNVKYYSSNCAPLFFGTRNYISFANLNNSRPYEETLSIHGET